MHIREIVVYMSSMVCRLEIIKTILYHVTVNINTSLYSYRGVSCDGFHSISQLH